MRLIALWLCIAWASNSLAMASEWHWDTFGSSGYSGNINLQDDIGSALNYQRFDAAASPSLFGSTSVQSPITVVAGTDIKMEIAQGGVLITKPICIAPKTPKIFVAPVTVCNFGQGNAIGGINAWADNVNSTSWRTRVAGWFQGYGWRTLDSTQCGRVQVTSFCE